MDPRKAEELLECRDLVEQLALEEARAGGRVDDLLDRLDLAVDFLGDETLTAKSETLAKAE